MLGIEVMAYRFLLKNAAYKLPVTFHQIQDTIAQMECQLATYEEGHALLVRWDLLDYAASCPSFVCRLPDTEQTILFYSDGLSLSARTFCVLHEIGHLVLEHTVHQHIVGNDPDDMKRDAQEAEADSFARYVLAPPCVLSACGIVDADEIMRVSQLSSKEAEVLEQELRCHQGQRSKSGLLEEEDRLLARFSAFIRKYQETKQRKNLPESHDPQPFQSNPAAANMPAASEPKPAAAAEKTAERWSIGRMRILLALLAGLLACLILVVVFQMLHAQNDIDIVVTGTNAATSITQTTPPSSAPTNTPVASTGSADTLVYVMPSGSVYHTDPDCQYVNERAVTIPLSQAQEEDLTLCKRCAD